MGLERESGSERIPPQLAAGEASESCPNFFLGDRRFAGACSGESSIKDFSGPTV